jgi:molybdate transport system substrate-binding protein
MRNEFGVRWRGSAVGGSARAAAVAGCLGALALGAAGCGSNSSSSSSSSPAAATSASSAAGGAASSGGAAASSGGGAASAAGGAASSGGAGEPTVLAAASLSKVLPAIFPAARYTFGGSGALEADIEQGAPADVFAAASTTQPAQLYAKKLITKPVQFATNTLVLIVPRTNPAHIHSVSDITRSGVKLVICNATVPCGDYARKAFANLGITARAMRNVVSQTTDVTQTVAEVALGQADAGFVYITDAKAAAGRVSVVRLPAAAKPQAQDEIAVVTGGRHRAAAQRLVARVLSAAGQRELRAAGFGAP